MNQQTGPSINANQPLSVQQEEIQKLQIQMADLLKESKRTRQAAGRAKILMLNWQKANLPSGSGGVGNEKRIDDKYRGLIKELQGLALNEHAVAVTLAADAVETGLSMVERRLWKQPVVTKQVDQAYNRCRVTIQNIPASLTQAEAIQRYLGDGRDLIHWDDSPDCVLLLKDEGTQTMVAYMQSSAAAKEVATRLTGLIENDRELLINVEILQRTLLDGNVPLEEKSKKDHVAKIVLAVDQDFKEPPKLSPPPPDPCADVTSRQGVFPIIPAVSVKTGACPEPKPSQSKPIVVQPTPKLKVVKPKTKPKVVQPKPKAVVPKKKVNPNEIKRKVHRSVVCIRGLPAHCASLLPPLIDSAGFKIMEVNNRPKIFSVSRDYKGQLHELVFVYMESADSAFKLIARYNKKWEDPLPPYKLVWEIAGMNIWSRLEP